MSYWEVLFSHSLLIGVNLREDCSTNNYVTRSVSYYMSYWDRNTEQNKTATANQILCHPHGQGRHLIGRGQVSQPSLWNSV